MPDVCKEKGAYLMHKPYSEFETRQQLKTFAHTLDGASFILRALDFPLHKLRDVVDGLQGAGGGRSEFELSHLALARRLRHTGQDKTAETYAARKVAALNQAQRKTGRLLFTITPGGGIEHKRTHYVDHLTPAAVWMMQQARASDMWAENPSRAIEAFARAAIELLPEAASEDERERNPMQIEDDLYIQRMLSQSLNCALKACDRVAENGGDDIAVARMTAERLLRYAEDRRRSRTSDVGDEPLQICRGSDENSNKTEGNPNMLAAALDYVNSDDIPVFPVKADKSPYTPNGFKDATRDPATVREMWRRTPDAGIGVPTGEASGWLVLDIDPRHGGDASLTALIETHGDAWLETMQARTGGGGHHIIFAFPQSSSIRNSAGRLGEGIDVRGEGGYIIAAPSLHASGRRYEWLNNFKPAQPPEWLLKLLTEERGVSTLKTQPRAKSSPSIGALIPEGERNQALFKIGCSLRGQGCNRDEIEAELIDINSRRCSPPLPDVEVQKIARSAASYAPNRVAVGV